MPPIDRPDVLAGTVGPPQEAPTLAGVVPQVGAMAVGRLAPLRTPVEGPVGDVAVAAIFPSPVTFLGAAHAARPLLQMAAPVRVTSGRVGRRLLDAVALRLASPLDVPVALDEPPRQPGTRPVIRVVGRPNKGPPKRRKTPTLGTLGRRPRTIHAAADAGVFLRPPYAEGRRQPETVGRGVQTPPPFV